MDRQAGFTSGEEDQQEMKKVTLPDLEYPKITKDLLTTVGIDGGTELIDYDKTIIYIDPLDGTAEFKAGRIQSVSVLLGVSISGIAKYGVVQSILDQDYKIPVTRFGGSGLGVYRYSELGLQKIQRLKQIKKIPFRIIVSESMAKSKSKELQMQLSCEVEGRLATGTRIIYLLQHPERCQAYLQKTGPQAQDECAPFALARQLGVIIHNFEGEQITMSDPYNGKRFVAYWEEVGDSIRSNLKQIEHLF